MDFGDHTDFLQLTAQFYEAWSEKNHNCGYFICQPDFDAIALIDTTAGDPFHDGVCSVGVEDYDTFHFVAAAAVFCLLRQLRQPQFRLFCSNGSSRCAAILMLPHCRT